MIGGNPFTQTRFSGSVNSSSPSNYSYSRNYFPLRNQSNNNIKPAFLLSSQVSYPTLPSDFRSPYSHFINNQQVKPKKQYVSNPFLKSHLFESNPGQNYASRINSNDIGANYLYVGTMAQSTVTPIYSNYNDGQSLKQKSSREKKSKLKKISSEEKIGPINYNNQYSPRNNVNNVKQSTIEKLYQGTKEAKEQKYYNPQEKNYKEETKFGYGQSSDKQFNKNQREFEKVDDPLAYNIPSFSMKKRQDSSPTFTPQDYVAKQSLGGQSLKGNIENIPNTLKYNGKTFHFVPCLEDR